ncbi:hypothetical protein [Methylobacterium aquaticum]|uniref:hypothetical protein n=1 Tax=Methylobacterium aquaticum TaxID=270351 RepID=UPI000A4D153B|nr:hypothetical protein [Methylobacterium aquaticum]
MSEDIKLTPLAGYTTYTLPQSCILADLNVVPHEQAFQTGERRLLRVSMTSKQARELAQMLLNAAEATEMGQAPSAQRN